jgi:hypothetical protein
MNVTGSGAYPMIGFDINVESLASVTYVNI